MNPDFSSERWRAADIAALLARLVLGALMIYMGASKAADPAAFLKLVRQYDAIHHFLLLNLVASTLPWFELFCGILLVLGIGIRGTALNLAVLLAVFTVLIYLRGRALSATGGLPLCAIRFDCGCGAGEVWVCRKLAENTGLFLLAVWLAIRPRSRFALRHSLTET